MQQRSFLIAIFITAFLAYLIALLALFFVKRAQGGAEANKKKHEKEEPFSNADLNSTGGDLNCADLKKRVLKLIPTCGVRLPRVITDQFCIDGRCMNENEVSQLIGLSNDVKEREKVLKQEFSKIRERLNAVKRRQTDKRSFLANQFGDLKGDLKAASDGVQGVKERVREVDDSINARGGDRVVEKDGYRYHVFKTVGESSFYVKRGGKADVLIVGGGGHGEVGGTNAGRGGGGAGGLVFKPNMSLDKGGVAVKVGDGSGPVGTNTETWKNGEDSEFGGVIARGGGHGGSGDGGSGGGIRRSSWSRPGRGIPGQGHDGQTHSGHRHSAGGGGGAGEQPPPGTGRWSGVYQGRGGDGKHFKEFEIEGSPAGWFAGGGAAGTDSSGSRRASREQRGGKGGGGQNRGDGKDGTGGGGSGRGSGHSRSSKGGSGIVIVRYQLSSLKSNMGALDEFSIPSVAAYSLRRLYTRYAGPQIRVKRASDATEANVYFDKDGGVTLIKGDDGASSRDMEGWSGGSEVSVIKWYDQSTSENHAVQRDGAPVLTDRGLRFRGRDAFVMEANDTDTLTSSSADGITGYALVRHGRNNGTRGIFGGGSRLHFELRGRRTWRIRVSDAFRSSIPSSENKPYSIAFRKDRSSGQHEMLRNGSVFARQTNHTAGWNAWGRVGGSGGPPGIGKSLDGHRASRFWNGHIENFVLFDTLLDDDDVKKLDNILRG